MATDLAAAASTGSMNDEYQKRLFAIRHHQQQLGEQVSNIFFFLLARKPSLESGGVSSTYQLSFYLTLF